MAKSRKSISYITNSLKHAHSHSVTLPIIPLPTLAKHHHKSSSLAPPPPAANGPSSSSTSTTTATTTTTTTTTTTAPISTPTTMTTYYPPFPPLPALDPSSSLALLHPFPFPNSNSAVVPLPLEDAIVITHGLGSPHGAIVIPFSSPELGVHSSTSPSTTAWGSGAGAGTFGSRLAAGLPRSIGVYAHGNGHARSRTFSTASVVMGLESALGLKGIVGSFTSASTTTEVGNRSGSSRSNSSASASASTTAGTGGYGPSSSSSSKLRGEGVSTPFFTSSVFGPYTSSSSASASSSPPSPPSTTTSLPSTTSTARSAPPPPQHRPPTSNSSASSTASHPTSSDLPLTSGFPFPSLSPYPPAPSPSRTLSATNSTEGVEGPPLVEAHRGFVLHHGAFGIPKRGWKGVGGAGGGGEVEAEAGRRRMNVAAAGGQLGLNAGIRVGVASGRAGAGVPSGGRPGQQGAEESTSAVGSGVGGGEALSVQVGEDAYFLRNDSLGVADGVGGLSGRKGANSALFSRKLMQYCSAELGRYEDVDDDLFLKYNDVDPVEILQVAFERCVGEAKAAGIVGASTALLAVLRRDELRVANMGDCCCSVIRGSDYIFRSEEQQHSFNYPFQVGTTSKDVPIKDAQRFTIKVQKDDIVILSSDGLVDNLFDDDILEEVLQFAQSPSPHPSSTSSAPSSSTTSNSPSSQQQQQQQQQHKPTLLFRRFEPQALSEALCSRAKAVSEDDMAVTSPFQQRAMEEGIHYVGGKADDITVAIGVIGDLEDSPDRR